MIYTAIDQVQQGDYLGRNIYASDGRILLHEGVQLTIGLLSKLRHMGVHAIYLKDDRFNDIEVEEVISEKTKRKAITTLSESYQYVQNGHQQLNGKAITTTIKSIIDEIFENQDLLITLTDIRTEDNELFVHSVNVCIMSVIIGLKVGLDRTKLQELAIGALLHDIGKVIDNDSTAKGNDGQGDLNDHTWKGFNLLRKNKEISTLSAHIALTHHEHVDGSGSPRQLGDKDIHVLSKIVAVTNHYDNLISSETGARRLHPYEACEEIMGLTNIRFSHPVVWRFLRAVAFYPTGSQVKLSTGETGVVVGQHTGLPQRPIVRTYKIHGSADDYEIKELDLAKATTVFITEVVT
ncbi:HD-GYP domain-containing protein [Desertibacillus haloalkaliphilus]|uniref:HD-GYP domain-containing protein n=1 Tax=Desertibacillus haloalkaliphilus TaxID=1328930 RepID=UPI001C275B47|nr:HD domain-containing phosphohydrolase [Desertibacillus haloalkaliphilus]MBU8906782.1 HD domain-containing protein [Desertibacillus haloalkaliphilus]